MSHFLIVANAAAGSSTQDEVHRLAGIMAESDTVSLRWTDPDDDLDALIADVTPDAMVIAGGDGSINHVVNSLGSELLETTPIGIIPLGTANDLARSRGIPLDATEAATFITRTKAKPVALLRGPDNEWATNNIHIGLGVAAASRGTDWKGFLGRLAYPAGAIVEAVDFDGVECEVTVDGEIIFSGSALTVMMLLGRSAGGGFELGSPNLEDGSTAEVLVVTAGTTPERAQAAAALATGDDVEGVTRVPATEMTIECEYETTEGEIDGEFRTWQSPIRFRVIPEAWNLIVE